MKKDADKDTRERGRELAEQIYDALIEKGWLIPQTEEEVLRAEQALARVECSPMPAEMADPRRLFDRLADDPAEMSREEPAAAGSHASVLADLRGRTRLPASQIAARMGVTVPFLSAVGRYPKVVPARWRRELDARAERALGTERGVVMRSFEHPYQAQMAASRDEAYAAEPMTLERILEQSGMDEEQRREWLRLASGE